MVKAPNFTNFQHRSTTGPQRFQQQSVKINRTHLFSISYEIRFGTRGSEVQILSPRPLFSLTFSTLTRRWPLRFCCLFRYIRKNEGSSKLGIMAKNQRTELPRNFKTRLVIFGAGLDAGLHPAYRTWGALPWLSATTIASCGKPKSMEFQPYLPEPAADDFPEQSFSLST